MIEASTMAESSGKLTADELLERMNNLNMRTDLTREEIQAELKKLIDSQRILTIPQSEALPGMVVNNSGQGYSYRVDDLTKLKRYIVIGDEQPKYNVKETKKPQENLPCLMRLIADNKGKEVIDTITEFAVGNRVAREEFILLILRDCALYAHAAKYDENRTLQRAAYDSVVKICNIPTKLFRFLELCDERLKKNWTAPGQKPLSKTKRKRKGVPPVKEEVPSKKKKKRKRKSKAKAGGSGGNGNHINAAKRSSAWGRMRRRGIAAFYTDPQKNADRLLLLLSKYKSRHNWSHVQVLGYAHPKIKKGDDDEKEAKDIALTYCTRGYEKFKAYVGRRGEFVERDQVANNIVQHIRDLHKVQQLDSQNDADVLTLIKIIKDYKRGPPLEYSSALEMPNTNHSAKPNNENKRVPFQIVREHIPTGFLKSATVWEALLIDMPMTALIRNLGKMTSLELFRKPENVKLAVEKLNDQLRVQRARIHPIKVLLAMKIYEQGHGDNKGHEDSATQLSWQPHPEIVKALDTAFYLSFKTKKGADLNSFATGKKFMLALDVSGSMTWSGCYGCEQLTPAVASTALAMVTWNIEENCKLMAFGSKLEDLEGRLRKDMTVNEAMAAMSEVSFGRTDCALPMTHALEHKMDVDVFVVYTDSDTWYGRIHPSAALLDYRKKMNKPEAKLLVVAMQTNDFSIADPEDRFMMDICGFDSEVPSIMNEFVSGNM